MAQPYDKQTGPSPRSHAALVPDDDPQALDAKGAAEAASKMGTQAESPVSDNPHAVVAGECDAPSDEVTGASPGTAQACSDLGLNSLEANLKRLGIKPPGQA